MPEDIEQEVWVLCLDALSRYNPKLGELENFLRNHVSNRLKNLKRDKYFRPDKNSVSCGWARVKMNLVNALPLGGGDIAENDRVLGSSGISPDPLDTLLAEETHDYIVNALPPHLVNAFYAVVGGNRTKRSDVQELRDAVRKILEELDSNG